MSNDGSINYRDEERCTRFIISISQEIQNYFTAKGIFLRIYYMTWPRNVTLAYKVHILELYCKMQTFKLVK